MKNENNELITEEQSIVKVIKIFFREILGQTDIEDQEQENYIYFLWRNNTSEYRGKKKLKKY